MREFRGHLAELFASLLDVEQPVSVVVDVDGDLVPDDAGAIHYWRDDHHQIALRPAGTYVPDWETYLVAHEVVHCLQQERNGIDEWRALYDADPEMYERRADKLLLGLLLRLVTESLMKGQDDA